MIHLCVIPSATEVDHGPPLFYHLPAHRQGRLPTVVADPPPSALASTAFSATPPNCSPSLRRGYRLKESRISRKLGLRLRRVRLKATGQAFSVRPSSPCRTWPAGPTTPPARCSSAPSASRSGPWPASSAATTVLVSPGGGLGRNSIAGTTLRRARCPSICWPTSTTSRATARRTTSPPPSVPAAASARPWRKPQGPKTCGGLRGVQGGGPGRAAGVRPGTVSADGWASTHQAWLGCSRWRCCCGASFTGG